VNVVGECCGVGENTNMGVVTVVGQVTNLYFRKRWWRGVDVIGVQNERCSGRSLNIADVAQGWRRGLGVHGGTVTSSILYV
jgi:hypothetical protein